MNAKPGHMDLKEIKEIWEKVKENSKKQKSCKKHDFERAEPGRWVCKNCGCIEPVEFVVGYEQGLEHGKHMETEKLTRRL